MVVKNDGCTKWVGAIHEDLMPMRQLDVKMIEGIDRLHLYAPDSRKESSKRNLVIAAKQVDKDPDDPRTMWNLANAQIGTADYKGAEESFAEFIASSRSKEEIYLAHMRLADIYKAQEKREQAVRELQIAIGIEPTLPDAYLMMAYFYFSWGDYDNSIRYSLEGLPKRPRIMQMIVFNPRDYDFNPMMLFARALYEKNQLKDMLTVLEGCLKIRPTDTRLELLVKQTRKDVKLFEKANKKFDVLKKIKDKKKLKGAIDNLPLDLRSHPGIVSLRNQTFIKETSTGKDLVIYCGNTAHTWNPELFKTKGFGGSEEAVIHLAREWAKLGWNVTVYNNCGHKEMKEYVGAAMWQNEKEIGVGFPA
ncbi:MAG TPA: hypothetical protein VIJ14_00640, partial [Rhabdochlamydiaceae bacterium]